MVARHGARREYRSGGGERKLPCRPVPCVEHGRHLLGASVVSQSWGLLESELGSEYEQQLESTYYTPAFNTNKNLTFLAASGDGSASMAPYSPQPRL